MPNQPGERTVTISFTLPKALSLAVKRKAKSQMTNKSEFVRRALMNYLPKDEQERVLREIEGNPAVANDIVNLMPDAGLDPKVKEIADDIELLETGKIQRKRRKKKGCA